MVHIKTVSQVHYSEFILMALCNLKEVHLQDVDKKHSHNI